MRLVFFGSPHFAIPSLRALLAVGHAVALVVSQPDRPVGRGQRLAAPPVAALARDLGLPLWQTATLKGAETEQRLRAAGADAMALAAFAALVPAPLLDIAQHGILNVHPSLLPRWRGAAPIQSALLAGDAETGVTIIRLVSAMDAGPVLLRRVVPVRPEDDYLSLEPRLADLGAALLVEALAGLAAGALAPVEQSAEGVTYSRKIQREDARIDWTLPAETIRNQVRAYRGWPQAFTTWQGKLLKVLRATLCPPGWRGPAGESGPPGLLLASADAALSPCGEPQLVALAGSGALRLDEVVLEGRRTTTGPELLRGYPGLAGSRLG